MDRKKIAQNMALKGAVELVVEEVRKKGITVNTEDLMNMVKSHAAGASASLIAAGIVPGAGGAIAVGVEISFVWSMYYRICKKLGIRVKKNIVKSLGAASVTDMGANIASEVIASMLLSIIPGIGTLGSVAINGLMGYSLTYYSGVIFMNLLVKVFKVGVSLDEMDADEIKSMMNNLTQEVTYDSIKKEVNEAYKNRKNDRKANPLDEEETAPVKPLHSYWLHIGVDFGSTNSVMAWRLYKWSEEENWKIDLQNNKENNIVRCPSILVFKKDNPNHPAVQAEDGDVIIGSRAEALANDAQEPAIAHTNFKPVFYDALRGSESESDAIELIGLFLEHLYQLYQSEIVNCLPNSVLEDMSCTVHFSTPVRAEKRHRDIMAELAKRAGFCHNGTDQFIDFSRNEAECVMHLGVDNNISNIQKLMEMGNAKSALNLLFIDIGGSTTDIELIKQELHSTGKSTQVLAMWPRENVQYMLGGREVDRAIFDYLIKTECLVPRFANACWDYGTGKTLFRKLKENNNEILRAGKEIASLGTIRFSCGDPDEEETPRNKYKDYKITREVFEQKICARYINDLCKAVHDVMKNKIDESELDAIFVTGAGSRLYFIHDLLLGRYGERPLQFTQIQQDENRLFDKFEDPATCCAEGAISGVM